MKQSFLLVVVVWCALFVASPAAAQSGAARGTNKVGAETAAPAAAVLPPSTLPSDPAVLYADASDYAERKFDEFKRGRVPYSAQLEAEVLQQQRELAARHAAQLVARGQLKGTDNYYLGLLYMLAGRPLEALPALRRFLATDAETKPEFWQRARFIVGTQAAALSRFDEAEAMLTAYGQNEPRSALELFRLHNALSNAYYQSKKLEPGAMHAAAGFALVKDPQAKLDSAQRARLVGNAGLALAQFHLKLKREPEAVAVLEELLRLGLSLPAAHLFEDARELLVSLGHKNAAWRLLETGATGEAAPELKIIDWIDQKPTTLAELRGRVVLLDFWATWCGPCQVTMPKLKALHERYKDKGLVVIGLTQLFGRVRGAPLTPGEELGYLRSFKKEQRLPYGFAVAEDERNDLRYGVRSIPTAFLLDKQGRVRYITVGASDNADEALGKAIKKLLAEP